MKKTLTLFLLAFTVLATHHSYAQCNDIQGSHPEETATAGTVDISWFSLNPDAGYTIEYGLSGFAPGEGTTISGTKISNEGRAEISGLSPNTQYMYYIQENCGETMSQLAGPYGLQTDKICRTPQNVSLQPGATFFIVQWNSLNPGATYHLSYGEGTDPFQQTGTLVSGITVEQNNEVRIEGLLPTTYYWIKLVENCSNNETSHEYNTVIMTTSSCSEPYWLGLQERGRDFLSVYWHSQNFQNGNIVSQGGYSIEYGPTGFTPGTGTTVSGTFITQYIETTISGLQTETSYDFYVSETCDQGTSSTGGPFTYTTIAACATADFFNVDNEGVGVVELNISSYNPGAEYRVEYGPAGFVSGEGTVLTGTFSSTDSHNEITVSNLSPSTEYEFRLIENCVDGGSTEEITASIITLDQCPTPQYFYISNQAVGVVEAQWETFMPGSAYTIEYGLPGFASGEGTTIYGTSSDSRPEVTISGLETSTVYEFRLEETCPDNVSTMVVTAQITTIEACPMPFEVDLGYTDSHDIGFEWDSYNIGQSYTIEYGLSGFVPGTGMTISGTVQESNPVVVSGLTPETAYDMYIIENCSNGATTTAGPFSASTTAIFPVPANDNCANAITVTAGTTAPNAYSGTNIGATGEDKPESCSFEGGGQFSKGVWYKYSATGTTPVNFNLCTGVSDFDTRMEIYQGTCPSLTCIKAEDDDDNCTSNDPIISLATEAGVDYYIYVSGYEGEKGNFELQVQEDPSFTPCVGPSDAVVSNVTTNSVEVSWTSSNTGSWFAIAVGLDGFNPYTEDGIADSEGTLTASNTFSFTGLNPATDYDIYVYEQCNGNDEYILGGPYSFTTATVTSTGKANSTYGYVIFTGETIKLINFEDVSVEEVAVYNLSGLTIPFNLNGDELTIPNAPAGMYLVSVRDQHDHIHYAKVLVK